MEVSWIMLKQTKYEWKDYRESGNMFYWIIQWLCVEIWRRHNEKMCKDYNIYTIIEVV